ncbi:hypothetical protein K439DRAFT_743910 [Ramaria rubella]|nr:hypothetical protein K439DRAFT_743910 [Ramaria rubella]
MSDRDAAEALDALGKAGRRSAPIHLHPSHDGMYDIDQGQEPQRKRARKTKGSNMAASDRESSVGTGQREDGSAAHSAEDMQRDRVATPANTHTWDIHQQQHPAASPHGQGGFDLPPLAELDVLSPAHAHAHHLGAGSRSFSYSGPGVRARSPHEQHTASHQNTSIHSPSSTTQGSLQLPPLSHSHSHSYLPNHLGSHARSRGPETHAHVVFSQQQHGQQQTQQQQVQQQPQQHQTPTYPEQQQQPMTPTYADLAAHYNELHEERRKLEGLLAKTDDIMRGLKRGLDELRAAGAPGSNASQEPVRLSPRERREREVVWRVEENEGGQ